MDLFPEHDDEKLVAETAPQIVPFGKYKGKPVVVLAQDHAYCEWLLTQDWFRTRYVGIQTLIVNQFGAPSETPEHNALQALFLDPIWRLQCLIALGLGRLITKEVRRYERLVDEFLKMPPPDPPRYRDINDYYIRQCQEHASQREDLRRLDLSAIQWHQSAKADFEVSGKDVQMDARAWSDSDLPAMSNESVIRRHSFFRPLEVYMSFGIECKPTMGDDYPAVLRQMKANNATVLIAETIQSRAVSVDQIRAIFKASGLTVLTVTQIKSAVCDGPFGIMKWGTHAV